MHSSRFITLGVAIAGLGAFCVAAACPAQAQLQVTLNNPNQVFDTSLGTTVLSFSGTIQNLTNDMQVISQYAINPPYSASGQLPTFRSGQSSNIAFGTPPMRFAPGSSYQGFLFSFTLDQTTPADFYHLTLDGSSQLTLPAQFLAQERNAGTGTFYNSGAAYSIRVTSGPVPEASTVASFGLLLALGAGGVTVAARRRKRALPGL